MKIVFSVALVVLFSFSLFYFLRNDSITNYPSEGKDILAFGDSLVEGVGATDGNDFVSLLSKKLGRPIINLGRSGDTTKDGVERLKEIDNYNPKAVILLLGGNDYLKKVPIEETRSNLNFIIKNIQDRGAVVLLLGVRGGILKDDFKKEFKKLQTTHHTAFISNILKDVFGNAKYMSDAIHPNNLGYQIIADRVFPVLKKITE